MTIQHVSHVKGAQEKKVTKLKQSGQFIPIEDLLKERDNETEVKIEIDQDQKAKNTAEAERDRLGSVRTVAPTSQSGRNTGAYDSIILASFGPTQFANAKAIVSCESKENASATHTNKNGTHDSGLFQINDVHLAQVNGDRSRLFDPTINTKVAAQIYKDAGNSWKPWSCSRKIGLT